MAAHPFHPHHLCWLLFFINDVSSSPDKHASAGGCSDDYAHPPPPVSAMYSLSLPNSPVLYKKGLTAGHSRSIRTPGRTFAGMSSLRAQTSLSSPTVHQSTQQTGLSTLPTPGRTSLCQTGSLKTGLEEPLHKGCQIHLHQYPRPPEQVKQSSVEELRSTFPTAARRLEQSPQDIRNLRQKMVATTEMIPDNVEENAQALNLLAEVVEKLQGLIVASRQPEPLPPHRHHTPLQNPPMVLTVCPKVLGKPPTPYPCQLSSSSSCSSSSTSVSSCEDYTAGPDLTTRCTTKAAVSFGVTSRMIRCGGNQQVKLNNGPITRGPLEDQRDCDRTTKKKLSKF